MIKNRYIKRRVAETDSRACFLCYKPTSVVLVNEVPSADFFYACETHLNDPGFAMPDKESVRLQDERQREIKELREQWEEVQRKKKASKDSDSPSESETKSSKEDSPQQPSPPPSLEPKQVRVVYELNRGVYNLRIGSKKRAAQEKKTKSMLETPGIFPDVPKHKPT